MTDETKPEIPLPDNITKLLIMMRDLPSEEAEKLMNRWVNAQPPSTGKSNARYKGVNFD